MTRERFVRRNETVGQLRVSTIRRSLGVLAGGRMSVLSRAGRKFKETARYKRIDNNNIT